MKSLARSIRTVLPAMLVLLVLAGLLMPVYAQAPSAQPAMTASGELTYGIRLGALYNDFTGDAIRHVKDEAGFSGGAYLNYRFHRRFALQPEVLFSTRSGNVDHTGVLLPAETVDYTFGMLDVPVLLKYYPFAGRSIEPNLFIGPMASFTLYRDLNFAQKPSRRFDPSDQYRTGTLGVTFGAGFEKRTWGRKLSFDTRYTLGLTNLFRDDHRPDFRMRGWTVTVGVGL
ncbi:porin family protein [Rhodocaloribacter sp.]